MSSVLDSLDREEREDISGHAAVSNNFRIISRNHLRALITVARAAQCDLDALALRTIGTSFVIAKETQALADALAPLITEDSDE